MNDKSFVSGVLKVKTNNIMPKVSYDYADSRVSSIDINIDDYMDNLYKNLVLEIKELFGNDAFVRVLFYEIDLHNIILLHLDKKNKTTNRNDFIDYGFYNYNSLYLAIFENNYDKTNDDFKTCLKEEDNISNEITFQYLKYLYELSKKCEGLKEYLDLKIDLKNVLVVLRSKRLKLEKEEYESMFIPLGTLEKNVFNLEKEEFRAVINSIASGKLLKLVDEYYTDDDINKFSRMQDILLFDCLSDYKYSDSPYLLGIYYVMAKKIEFMNLKRLYLGVKYE